MDSHPNSPNGRFERHGFTVVRTPSPNGQNFHRAIYDPSGQQVLNRAGIDAELQFCREHRLMTAESDQD